LEGNQRFAVAAEAEGSGFSGGAGGTRAVIPLPLRDRLDEIGVDIAQQFAIYEELASLLWVHYSGWEDL
jgi:hypothetical protein